MNKDIAIKVENLSKVYKLYNAPIDRMKEALHPRKKSYHKEFYALNDVSFEIKRGECVGILGKNGAGKSTILKIITGVLTPTSGQVTVNGKISALLELGAGFNPEYTGMENIYFQGNLMGFAREEMDAKVQGILEFAEIGAFIEQPVKNYSSGMFARLAFAVAISVEPDILIVDEALSVGDAAFQNKCMRKMIQIMEQGTTVLFVSHDTQAINKFCTKAVWLKDGTKYMEGETEDVTNAYMSFSVYGLDTTTEAIDVEACSNNALVNYDWLVSTDGLECFGDGKAKILRTGFLDGQGKPSSLIKQGDTVQFVCEMVAFEDLYDVGIGVMLKDRLNIEIITFNSYMYSSPLTYMKKNTRYIAKVNFKVPKIFPTDYTVTVALSDGTQLNHNQQHWIHVAATIRVVSIDLIDACIVTLYKNEVEYSYEQV
ncbi:MAG: ABC transporter ATP-binding protein [Burkholderiales bacterium]|nr:ABC transporter ATP-binding protein [Burkholderiales bacterium]